MLNNLAAGLMDTSMMRQVGRLSRMPRTNAVIHRCGHTTEMAANIHARRMADMIFSGNVAVQVVEADLDKRKHLSEELRNLQRRLKQFDPAAPPFNHN